MSRIRFTLTLNCLLLISLLLTSCAGAPSFISPTPTPPTDSITSIKAQAYPPALVETVPPSATVIGHLSPLTFHFNQAMNKASVESAFNGLPDGAFTWTDEATLVFNPAQPYSFDSKLEIEIANSIQSASGFRLADPIQLSYTVADYLRPTNQLPKANATDVDVDAAIAVSFNQPVVPLGAETSSLPPAFNIAPAVEGRGEWINTSTYIFHPEPAMQGGVEYTVSVSEDLKTGSGVGLDRTVVNAWKFITSRPRVVSLSPSPEDPVPPDAEIKLTFNQPMDRPSVQSNFSLSGNEGTVNGTFSWNADDTELTFTPERLLARGVGYALNIGLEAKSDSGMALGETYGAVLRTYGNFAVSATEADIRSVSFTFTAPLAEAEYENLVTITPAVTDLTVNVEQDRLSLFNLVPGTEYLIEMSDRIRDEWGSRLGQRSGWKWKPPPCSQACT